MCPLCNNLSKRSNVNGADDRRYYVCGRCQLIAADSVHFLNKEDERARYETHNNSIENKGYVEFLNRIVEPMLAYIRPGMTGLDYGCGPGPVLSELLRKENIDCEFYDPLFFPEPIQGKYDFIVSTETFEHFYKPRYEIEKLSAMLPAGGYLGIMTELWDTEEQFETWYYTRDPTHVSFYHMKTIEFISREFGFNIVYSDNKRVFILVKQ